MSSQENQLVGAYRASTYSLLIHSPVLCLVFFSKKVNPYLGLTVGWIGLALVVLFWGRLSVVFHLDDLAKGSLITIIRIILVLLTLQAVIYTAWILGFFEMKSVTPITLLAISAVTFYMLFVGKFYGRK